MKRKLRPNVVSGGSALPLGNNFYLMKGKTHKQGGIDIGDNPKTGIEVENNEVVQVTPNNVRVFSAQPILHGISPAQALLNGGNPQHIFAAQEAWKQVNRVTDDGKKFADGGYKPSKEILDYIKKTEAFRDKWYQDGNGIWTIGYGFTGEKVKKLFPNGITREQADKYFADSIAKRALILAKDTPNWDSLSQNQRDALLSYHYNIGEGSYRNKHKNLQAALTNKDWDKVIANMDAGYNDKKNPGLRKRRDYERELFRSGSVTSLTGDEENAFQNWYSHFAAARRLDTNPDAKEHYYDYRGYWKNRTKEDEQNELIFDSHLPDTYKLPGHPTFSRESKYSTKKNPGGTWVKTGLGPIYDEVFVSNEGLKKFKNATFAYGGEKQNGQIEPSIITAKLPAKFNGSQAAARRYAEGYQFGKRIANERDKTVPYILAAANAPMLVEGMAVAPLATLGSLGGGYVGNKVGTKVGGPIGGIVGGLIGGGLGAGAGVGATAGLKQLGRYGNGVLDRLAESIVRVGDNADKFDLIGQLTNKNTIKYILNPKAKDLAYKMPYKYSGTDASMTHAFPGDVVDQFFGKYPVPDATYDYSVLPKGMQRYIAKNYPNKRIPIRDLKDIVDLGGGEVGQGIDMRETLKDFNYKDEINIGGSSNALFKKGSMETVLDPGGFNAYLTKGNNIKYNSNGTIKSGTANIKGVDIWKFKPSDYIKRYNYSPISLLSRLGLKFIDSRGTPIVHTFEGEMPFYIGEYKYGGIHIKPSKRGTFTAAAKRHHMSVQEFARKVLNNRANYSAAMVKKANFARNASKWHKKEFGGDMTKQFYITPNNIYKMGGKVEDKQVLGFDDKLGFVDTLNPSVVTATSPIEHITNYYRLKDFLNRRRKKAAYGTQTDRYQRYYDNGTVYYKVGDNTYTKEEFARVAGINPSDVDNMIFEDLNYIPKNTRNNNVPIAIDANIKPRELTTEYWKKQFPNANYSLGITDVKQPKLSELPGGTVSSVGRVPNNPYYSKFNIGLHKVGNYINNNPEAIGLGVNLLGNLGSYLINRGSIKGMKYTPAPIPVSAQKLPTEVNVNPEVAELRENIAGQEQLIKDNTASSAVSLARRQKARNTGFRQFQSLMGNKSNTELQLLTADRLNRQGVDAQNVGQYNQWRAGLYDFMNKKREMKAENEVAAINNTADAIAGPNGYLARKEERNKDILDMALIAATSPHAQNVIGSDEFDKLLRKLNYRGRWGLLNTTLNNV